MTPEQRAQFIANVPDAEGRREAERLCQAEGDAWKALERACEAAGIEVDDDIIGAHGDPAIIALNKAYDEASHAWDNCQFSDPIYDFELETSIRCSLTGLLIHEGDACLKDKNTGEYVLKSALGIPLDAITDEFVGLPVTASSHEVSSAEAVA